jgi:hypothetical protein
LAATAIALSAPAAEPMKPAIEVRIQSVNELVGYSGFVGEMVGQAEQFEQYGNAVKAFAGKKGIEGFDIKRPVGLYGEISKDVIDSPLVLLVPIADVATAKNALKNYLKLDLKEKSAGLYQTAMPNVPIPLFVRFADGYLQATLGNAANFDRAIAPKAFFGDKFSAIAEVKLHVERVPADVRKVLLGQVEFQLQKENDRVKETERSAGKRAFANYVLSETATALKTFLDDTKTVTVRLTAQPDSDQVSLDLNLAPRGGSPLAGMLANATKKPSVTAGRIPADNPIVSASINVALTDAQRKKFDPVVDELLNEAEQGVDAFVADLVKKFFASIEPTMKSGNVDFTMAMVGPESNGTVRMNAMLKMTKGLDLVDTLVEASKIIPAGIIEMKFDQAKVGDLKLHGFTIHENPGKLEELFGSATIWAGTSNDLLALGFEADGTLLKKSLAGKAGAAKIAEIDLAMGRLAVLLAEPDKRDAMKKAVKAIEITDSHADRIHLAVTGGNDLAIRLTAKGKALKVFAAIDAVNKR